MPIDNYDNMKIGNTPSLLDSISHKGFRMSGAMDAGHWMYAGQRGLMSITTEDINPESPVKPTKGSLYSCRGYSHFYHVYPDGSEQNVAGRPIDFRNYGVRNEITDTAFMKASFVDANGSGNPIVGYINFKFIPKSWAVHRPLISNNMSWVTPSFAANNEPILNISPNTSTEERRGYISFNYVCPNSHALGNRSFAVYVTQAAKKVDPVVLHPSFEIYRYGHSPLPRTSRNNPYVLPSQGSYTFYVGGFNLLSQLSVDDFENESLKCSTNKYSSVSATGAVASFTVTTPSSAGPQSVLGFKMTANGSTLNFYVAF